MFDDCSEYRQEKKSKKVKEPTPPPSESSEDDDEEEDDSEDSDDDSDDESDKVCIMPHLRILADESGLFLGGAQQGRCCQTRR
jgi:hypothetical protein